MNSSEADSTTRLNSRLRIFGLLAIPFVAVWASSSVRGLRPLADPVWFAWINAGFIVVALYLLIAPFLLQRPLRHRPVRTPGGVDGLLLLMGVGGPATVSMMPVVLLVVGSGSVTWVLPCAAFCLLVALSWCWRLRRVLL